MYGVKSDKAHGYDQTIFTALLNLVDFLST